MTDNLITLKHTNIPLSNEEMRVLFETRGKFRYVVNYQDSKLKGTGFLFYTSNLELPAEIDLTQDVPTEDKLELIKQYMTMSNLVDIGTLAHAVAEIVFTAREVEDVDTLFTNSWLTADEIALFIEQNKDLVNRWVILLDSLYVYALYINYEIENGSGINPVKASVPEKMDPTYIGNNFISVMNIPGFFEVYLTKDLDLDNTFFFTHQFTEYCYQGKNLYPFFATDTNWLFLTTSAALAVGFNNDTADDTTE